MDISFLVTSHNESNELQRILNQLTGHIVKNNTNDEIVVLDDYSDNPETLKILAHSEKQPFVTVHRRSLNKDFGAHKTAGSMACNKKFIVQLDADEFLSDQLLENLSGIIDANPTVELYRLPRVNIVRNITPEDAAKWGWRVTELQEFPGLSVVNFPDYQSRVYKKSDHIRWNKKLHETVVGADVTTDFPNDPAYAIIHDKTIERQRIQNEFYMRNWSTEANMGRG